jgi:hypothetical protein
MPRARAPPPPPVGPGRGQAGGVARQAGSVRAEPAERVCVHVGTEWERFYLFYVRSHKC